MEDPIFRKKSLDKLSSPEQLNDYIKVTNPGVWIIKTTTLSPDLVEMILS